MTSRPLILGASLFFVAVCTGFAACDASHGGGSDAGSSGNNSGGNGGSGFTFGAGGGPGGPLEHEPSCEGVDPGADSDGDGWTGAAGDCNDCTPQMNPGAQDYPGNNIDEDCNGAADDNPAACDGQIDLASADPMDGARAIGLCKKAQGESWGVISAEYITADGQPLAGFDLDGIGWGILPGFGPKVKPQEGADILVLSSGSARRPVDPGYESTQGYNKMYTTGAPPGYPKESPACPSVITGDPHDSAGLRLVLQSPTNATSLSFNFNFYTYEFPNYICSKYNDFFVAILTPKPASQVDGNISYDSKGNTISVNAGFLQVCHAQDASNGVHFDCPLGPGQLEGTGFERDFFNEATINSAATGWLQTTTPLESPGAKITVDFAIWDSGDGVLDSTVLIDNFQFGLDETATVTEPIPEPK